MALNKNEYGQTIRASIGIDVSTGTEYTLTLTPKRGTAKVKTSADGVTMGAVNVTDNGVQLIANTYIEYVLKALDLDYSGIWKKQGQATMTGKEVVGNREIFVVGD